MQKKPTSPRHRLAVSDDGQGFERRTGVTRRLLGVQTVQKRPHLGPALKAPATGHRHHLDTMGGEMGHWMRRCEDVHMAVNVPPEVLGRGGV